MTQMAEAVAQLRKEIEQESAAIAREKSQLDAREKILAGKEQALLVLERMGVSGQKASDFQSPPPSTHAADEQKDNDYLIQLNDLFSDVENRRRTLTDDVRDVVRRFGTQEFTVAHAEAAMKRLGIELVGKTPRARIALAITKLCDEKTVVRTFVGAGNVPHRYRLQAHVPPEDMLRYSILNNAAASASREQDGDEELSESSPNTDVANNKEGGAEK
jgi:hypothetical protein